MPMRVVSVVGARPQFVKAAPVSRALRSRGHEETLVHTGQHYDYEMSASFFEELSIPPPDVYLGVGSGSHGYQTGEMLKKIEKVLFEKLGGGGVDCVIVYGDTNSTLAGALAAAKLHIPVAHVEAGLRSFNRRMPEEINRVVADHVSSILFCPTEKAVENLRHEGITEGVFLVGDPMVDVLLSFAGKLDVESVLKKYGLRSGDFFLATVHRAENSDDPGRLRNIINAFSSAPLPVVFPVHPRTKKNMENTEMSPGDNVLLLPPLSYTEFISLLKAARAVLTDSGGVQKEAYVVGTPCITLRDETEWVETVDAGWNVLAGADTERIIRLMDTFSPPEEHPPLYGDGNGAKTIVDILEKELGGKRNRDGLK